jgi:hypothetical protein
MVNNLNDGMAWGLFPLVFAAAGMSLAEIGTLAAIYPAVWGLGQLFTGAWSDRIGRKGLIVAGMWVQAGGIVVIALGATFAGFRDRRRAARPRHGDGLPDAARRHRRRRAPELARVVGGRLPVVARHGLRGRCAARRRRRGRLRALGARPSHHRRAHLRSGVVVALRMRETQDQVRLVAFEQLEGLVAVVDGDHLVTLQLEELAQHIGRVEVVLDDEDPARWDRRSLLRRRFLVRRRCKWQAHLEGRAGAQPGAVSRDLATVQLDQAPGQRQPQPQAAGGAGEVLALLLKRLEDARELSGGCRPRCLGSR